MKAQATKAATLALASTFAGCASMPDVTVGYYEAKGALDVTVTQTAACTTGNVPAMTGDVVIAPPRYTSNTDPKARHTIDLSKLGNRWSKADATFEQFPDGRLKSINVMQTGQAGDVLRAAINLAAQFGLLKFTDDQTAAACEQLRKIVGDGKALTVVHRGSTDFPSATQAQIALHQISVDGAIYTALRPIFGTIAANYEITDAVITHAATIGKDEQRLVLTEPATAAVTVTISRGQDKAEWTGSALVPQHGMDYELPIQKAPAFGKNTFELALHDSGKVTKLRYAGEGDGAGILGVISEARTAGAGESTADEATRIKAEADLIYQQQRLVLCQTDPVNCPK